MANAVISFKDDNEQEIGKLIISGTGKLAFEGNMEKSAEIFFAQVVADYDAYIKSLHSQIVTLANLK